MMIVRHFVASYGFRGSYALLPVIVAMPSLTACAPLQAPEHPPASMSPAVATQVVGVAPLLAGINAVTREHPDSQADALTALRSAAGLPSATPRDVLQYAVALGAPRQRGSDPREASRLLATLLADEGALTSEERDLAELMQREFSARAVLLDELARQREDLEQQSRSLQVENQLSLQALAAENARLRRERDEAKRKLDAIAEIERSMIDREPEPVDEPEPVRPEQP